MNLDTWYQYSGTAAIPHPPNGGQHLGGYGVWAPSWNRNAESSVAFDKVHKGQLLLKLAARGGPADIYIYIYIRYLSRNIL